MERLSGPVGEETWIRAVPLGRFGTAEEIAAMAVVLSSPLAAFVTGAQIIVDGGLGLAGLVCPAPRVHAQAHNTTSGTHHRVLVALL
jgi:hypothetical protein